MRRRAGSPGRSAIGPVHAGGRGRRSPGREGARSTGAGPGTRAGPRSDARRRPASPRAWRAQPCQWGLPGSPRTSRIEAGPWEWRLGRRPAPPRPPRRLSRAGLHREGELLLLKAATELGSRGWEPVSVKRHGIHCLHQDSAFFLRKRSPACTGLCRICRIVKKLILTFSFLFSFFWGGG